GGDRAGRAWAGKRYRTRPQVPILSFTSSLIYKTTPPVNGRYIITYPLCIYDYMDWFIKKFPDDLYAWLDKEGAKEGRTAPKQAIALLQALKDQQATAKKAK
ncbi:MAG: hypothetical protein KGL95_11010, partial [Patescibacteria group bacterium]|nr:hypothetical protein [Patescibacteria group bacterium]